MRKSADKIVRVLAFLIAMLMAIGLFGCSANAVDESDKKDDVRDLNEFEYTALNLGASDDYDRSFTACDTENRSRYVGIFFFLTLGYHSNHSGIYDISKITDYGRDIDAFFSNTEDSPVGAAHFWGEPIWGYYRSDDPWVITKQVEMLTMAGLDFIALDVSNMVLYENTVDTLLEILLRFQEQGWSVPKVWFYCNQQSAETMDDKEVIKRSTSAGTRRKGLRIYGLRPTASRSSPKGGIPFGTKTTNSKRPFRKRLNSACANGPPKRSTITASRGSNSRIRSPFITAG